MMSDTLTKGERALIRANIEITSVLEMRPGWSAKRCVRILNTCDGLEGRAERLSADLNEQTEERRIAEELHCAAIARAEKAETERDGYRMACEQTLRFLADDNEELARLTLEAVLGDV